MLSTNSLSAFKDAQKQSDQPLGVTSQSFQANNYPVLSEFAFGSSQTPQFQKVQPSQYRESPFSLQAKQSNYLLEAGQTWAGSENSQKGLNPFSVSSDRARNSRTFKFREFSQKQNQQQQFSVTQNSFQPNERDNSTQQSLRSEQNQPLSERSQFKQHKTQSEFRSPQKKLQFSYQVVQNPYYQYMNPLGLAAGDKQNGINQSEANMNQSKKSIISNNSEIIKPSSSQSQQNPNHSFSQLQRRNEGGTPKNKSNNINQDKNGPTFMPQIKALNGNFTTERQQQLMPSSQKDTANQPNGRYGETSIQKRMSVQDNVYSFPFQKKGTKLTTYAMQATPLPLQGSLVGSQNQIEDTKMGASQQQNIQQNYLLSGTRGGKEGMNINPYPQNVQNSSSLSYSITSPNKDPNNLSQSQFHKVPKHINLSKTFSSPFLKKVHQLKKQQLGDVANGGKSPNNNPNLASRTLTLIPSTQMATPSNFTSEFNATNKRVIDLHLNLDKVKSREKSSSSESGRSLFESPLSPPPKNKLQMEMGKYKKELKESNSAMKRMNYSQQKTANSFFRVKKIDSNFDFQTNDSKFISSTVVNTNQQPLSQFSQSPNKTLTQLPYQKESNEVEQKPSNSSSDSQIKEDITPKNKNKEINEDQEGIYESKYFQNQQLADDRYDQQSQQFNSQMNGGDSQFSNLSAFYHNSYKKIENILEVNKFFSSNNKIEEEMLSLTMKNKALLPRKLGILSLKPQTGSPNGPLSARAAVKRGTLQQIFDETAANKDENYSTAGPQTLNFIESSKNTYRNSVFQVANSSSAQANTKYKTTNDISSNQSYKKLLEENLQKITRSNTSLLNLDILKGDKSKQKLNIAHQNIGSNYAEMISKALNHTDMQNLHTINLSNNHLTGSAVYVISKNLPESIQSIDLSNNSIGANGTRGLIPLFDSKRYYQLRKLNLENNTITDNGLKVIIPSIFSNMSIYVLNISHNKLSDQSCAFIKKLLQNSSYLQELYLHWNKISSKGGVLIAQGLSENLNIKVLDLSHNGLGAIPKLKCGQKIIQSCNVLESAVKHLDISYNQFTHEECLDISTSLLQNTTLYGIHLEGNESKALVDPRGFVFFPEKQNPQFEEHHKNDIQIVTQRIKSVNTKGPNKMQSFDCKSFDNCWICHGWTEIRFEMKSSSSDVFTGEPAFLHLDFEDYQPIYMDKDPEDPTTFFLNRMCPPNRKICFFFSDPCKNVIYFSKDYKFEEFSIPEGINLVFSDIVHHDHNAAPKQATQQAAQKDDNNKNSSNKASDKKKDKKDKKGKEKGEKNKKKENVKGKKDSTGGVSATVLTKQISSNTKKEEKAEDLTEKEEKEEEITEALDEVSKSIKKKFKVKYLDGTVIEYHAPTYVNYIETQVSKEIISKVKDYDPNVKAKPRQPETFFLITKTNAWHRGISLFRDYIPDSDALDKRCFEFDWQTSKLPKLLEKGKDIDDCKKILASVYSQMRIAYKYLSCTGIANDVFCITQNPFANFAQRGGIIDNNLLFIRDVDFNFISASNIALKAKTYRNPDKALIRNEFLEVMGRIALDKFIRNEKAKTNSEALKMFFSEEGLLNHLYEFDSPQEWRNTRYWKQECDEKLKVQLTFLKNLYNNFADSRKNEKRYFTTVKSMSLQEFKDMVYKFDLLDDLLVERDITISFNLAMMTQVDELNSDRHFQMQFVEFIEAISRLAEKKSMVPLGEIPEEYEVHERIVLQLPYKIESMLAMMKKKQESFSTKDNSNQQNQAPTQQQQQLSQQQQSAAQGVINLLKRQSQMAPPTPSTATNSQRQIGKMGEESINFIKKLTMKKTQNFDDNKKEQDKLNLKSIIHKILNKEVPKNKSNVNSPTKSPSKSSPKKQLAIEIEEMKKNQQQN